MLTYVIITECWTHPPRPLHLLRDQMMNRSSPGSALAWSGCADADAYSKSAAVTEDAETLPSSVIISICWLRNLELSS